ncbi:MAG: hypothetical protein HYV24_03015 [Deltaproteobacteria bacterium]|nr:hypothetical protein [Deltaproteobacteria bacterium]
MRASVIIRISALIVFLVIAGCSSTPKTGALLPVDDMGAGYHRESDESVFENDSISVRVRAVKDGGGVAILDELIKLKYAVFNMEIVNRSKVRIQYDPSTTLLTDDESSYLKPIDYTDLYDLKAGAEGGEQELSKMRGRFYDVSTTLSPGEKVSKLLIFKPFGEGMEEAELAVRDIYIGTEPIDATFRFEVK